MKSLSTSYCRHILFYFGDQIIFYKPNSIATIKLLLRRTLLLLVILFNIFVLLGFYGLLGLIISPNFFLLPLNNCQPVSIVNDKQLKNVESGPYLL